MHIISKVEKVLRAFSRRSSLDDFGGSYISQKNHIAIGGCGRSGTTLVRVIMDSHPRLCCGPESKLFLQETLDLSRLKNKFKLDAIRMGIRRGQQLVTHDLRSP